MQTTAHAVQHVAPHLGFETVVVQHGATVHGDEKTATILVDGKHRGAVWGKHQPRDASTVLKGERERLVVHQVESGDPVPHRATRNGPIINHS